MAVRLPRKLIPTLMIELQKLFPKALQIHGTLSGINRTGSDRSGIWVDRWPGFGAVLIRPDLNTTEFQVPVIPFQVKFFATNPESGKFLLSEQDVFSGTDRLEFIAAPEFLWPVIQAAGQSAGFHVDIDSSISWMFYLPDISSLPESLHVPDGYRLEGLHPECAPVINSLWNYNHGKLTEAYMETLIRIHPSVGIFEERTDKLAAFAMCYEDCSIANVYVSPDYRELKLAKLAITTLTRNLKVRGLVPHAYCYISLDNHTSVSVSKKLGFVPCDKVSWVHCTKKL